MDTPGGPSQENASGTEKPTMMMAFISLVFGGNISAFVTIFYIFFISIR